MKASQGQATLEYTVLLIVVLGLLMTFIRDIFQPVWFRMSDQITLTFEQQFSPEGLYRFQIH